MSEQVDRWDVAGLAERCRILRSSLGARGVPSETVGELPPLDGSLGAWIQCYARLTAALQRADDRKAARTAELRDSITAALDETPVPVRLSVPDAHHVYAKSFHALQFLETLDVALREVQVTVAALLSAQGDESASVDDHAAAALEPLVRSQAVRLWAWIITTPGVGLPFDDDAPELPDPPAWTKSLTPEDVAALAAAHVRANHTRLALIADAFPPEHEAKSRLSLGGFMGSAAQEMGRPARELLQRWSLGAVFAQVVAAAEAHREAYEAASGSTGQAA